MQQAWVWARRGLLMAAALVVLVAGGVYVGAEMVVRRAHDVPVSAPTPIAATPEVIGAGRRLAHVLGCLDCHGSRLEGRLFFSERGVADLVAPNLSARLPTYSDGELERAVRHGIRRDGTGLFAMPAASFYHLADDDLRALLAFLRQQPRTPGYTQSTRIGPLGRVGIVMGKFTTAPAAMDHAAPRVPRGGGDPVARGRYLATIACSECHGRTFEGGLDGKAPPLAIAAAYTDDAFRHLLRTGETPGKRALYLMGGIARQRFVHLTDGEIEALHTFLRTLAR